MSLVKKKKERKCCTFYTKCAQKKTTTDVYFSTVRGIKILLERLLLSVNPVKSCERTALTQLSSFCSHAAKDSSDLPIKMNLPSETRISMTQCFQRSHRLCMVQPGCHVRKRERKKQRPWFTQKFVFIKTMTKIDSKPKLILNPSIAG